MHDSDPHGRQPDHDAGGAPPHPCGAAPAGTTRQASGKPDAASHAAEHDADTVPACRSARRDLHRAGGSCSSTTTAYACGSRRSAHVGAALLPQRRALPRARDLRVYHPRGCGHDRDVEPGGPSYPSAPSGIGRPTGTTSSSSRAVPAVARRRVGAREVLRLFELPEVRNLGVPPTWLPVRVAFTAATAGRGGSQAER
jgi:hypothetical protein